MATTPNSIITAQTPVIGIATLTTPTAVTSRANITGTTGLTQLTPVSTNGKKVDTIRVQAKGTTVAATLFVWLYNGTTSFLVDEILIAAITPSATVAAYKIDAAYGLTGAVALNLPAAFQLFVSVTVANDVNVAAMGGDF